MPATIRRATSWLAKRSRHLEPNPRATLNRKIPSYCGVHHKKNRLRGVNRHRRTRSCLRGAGSRFAPWKEAMPEASDRGLFPVAPRKMAILAVKLLRNNFERAKHTHQRRSHEFSSHLWIFDIRRAALWATDKRRRDIWISRLPLNHEVLGLLEIGVFHHDFRVRQRARHETNLLQRRFVMNIGPQSCVVQASFELPRPARGVT